LSVYSDESLGRHYLEALKEFALPCKIDRVVEEPWSSSTKAYGAQTVLIANLYNPDGVAVSTSGNVFVADTGNNRVVEIPWIRASGVYGPATEIGSGLNSPHGVAVAANGDLYIADMGNNRVVEVLWDRSKDTYGAQTTVAPICSALGLSQSGQGAWSTLRTSGTTGSLKFPQAAVRLRRARAKQLWPISKRMAWQNRQVWRWAQAATSISWTTQTTG
jgi:hypothetical protein